MLLSLLSKLGEKFIVLQEEVQLYFDTDVPIYFRMPYLVNRHTGT